ncbi:MAG: ATP-dependent DNA helicase RecG [Treponema sp.]|jgi:ATP-dependent DNA helicase RecG|nr:ATP-dependent DNA helicase RecG [Treponema sp.]
MFLGSISRPIASIRGVGSKAEAMLQKAGITTVAGLLRRYPRDWEDRNQYVPLARFSLNSRACTTVTVIDQQWIGFGRMRTLKLIVRDETAKAALLCFKQNFLEKKFVPGSRWFISGKFYHKNGEIQSSAFDYEALGGDGGGSKSFGKILPVYPLSGDLTQKMLRKLVENALEQFVNGETVEDEIPGSIAAREGFLSKRDAIRAIHFPLSMEELEKARRSLIYTEFFYLEIMIGKRALERKGAAADVRPSSAAGGTLSALQQRLIERLSFELTRGQREAITEINADMSGPYPMARLLQGDVGSGKTLVAFLACLKTIEEGGQAVLMAPTELLARQHAENAARLLEPLGVRPAFLTGNVSSQGRRELLKRLAGGEVDLAVGTHALFSAGVEYRALNLVVVDEQHRFGVTQRSRIMAKGRMPDLLMMSATPIPRSLAFTVFGDLEVSSIRDMPPGRKPVKTHLASQSSEKRVYDFVRRELAAGRQAYFVYPLIGDDENTGDSGLKNAVSMAERLAAEIFPEFSTALLHSRVDEEEKRRIMESFRRGETRILVATSVVEVGVDVPNASCMVIEHAERFGLSALHQLRGRVGRGSEQAYCFLMYSEQAKHGNEGQLNFRGSLTEEGKQRLRVMLENSDGFVIAEEDLKLRGPGQIAGIEQSGYLKLGLADPVRDIRELIKAREDAFAILQQDPGLLLPDHRVISRLMEEAPPFEEVNL